MNEDWDFLSTNTRLDSILFEGVLFQVGDRVRIQPKGGADIMDLVLKDRVAVIEAIEQDFENRIYLALVLEDDPGKDLGMMRQPGHRFFYGPDEVQLIGETGRE